METALTVCSVQACGSTNIRRNASGSPSMSLGQALCVRHWNQLYVSGWTFDEMALRWTPMCWFPNCENEADTLDHDHSCCDNGRYRKKRCGRCNRGFVCSSCNREIGVYEARAGAFPHERNIEIAQYLDHWRTT